MANGEKIKRLRLDRGLRQAELAARTGLSVRTIRRVESGEAVDTETFHAYASWLRSEGDPRSVPEIAESLIARETERSIRAFLRNNKRIRGQSA